MCVICVHVCGWVGVCVCVWEGRVGGKVCKHGAAKSTARQRNAKHKTRRQHNAKRLAKVTNTTFWQLQRQRRHWKNTFSSKYLSLSHSPSFFCFTFCSLHQRFSLNADSSWNAWLAHWRLMLMLMMKVKQDSVPLCSALTPLSRPRRTRENK